MTQRPVRVLAVLALLAVTLLAYAPVLRAAFFISDDGDYVHSNSLVSAGLSWRGVVWAFTAFHSANWHPLTWLSHMVDCQFFALKPAGHHATNLALHAANTLLVLAFLLTATGSFGRAWLAALVFGVHPLHVESVAWIAERKEVLSTFFALLALLAYVRYGRSIVKPIQEKNQGKNGGNSSGAGPDRGRWFWASVALTACSLMSKPMWVTMPAVLLLLDYWPLRRVDQPRSWRAWWPLLREKWPLLVLSIASSILTVLAQSSAGAVKSIDQLSLLRRVCNIALSYARYFGKAIYPVDLAAFYPHPATVNGLAVLAALAWLIALTAFLAWHARRLPAAAVGWLWFLGMLVPVIGLVQVGAQAMADRYMYVPILGLLIGVLWAMPAWPELMQKLRQATAKAGYAVLAALYGLALVWLVALPWLTYRQCALWVDPVLLLEHTRTVIHDSARGNELLGLAYMEGNRPREAVNVLQEVTRNYPGRAQPWVYMGQCYETLHKPAEAEEAYRTAIKVNPDYGKAYLHLGTFLRGAGRPAEAVEHFRSAAQLTPNDAGAQQRLGVSLMEAGQVNESLGPLLRAVELRPDYAGAYVTLGFAQVRARKLDEAEKNLRSAVEMDPSQSEAREVLRRLEKLKRQK